MPWDKQDQSFKILINKRVTSDGKQFYEEVGDDTLNTHFDNVWINGIPSDPSVGVAQGILEQKTLFSLTEDLTVSAHQCYYAYESGNRLHDWISDKFGTNYGIHLYDSLNNEIFPTDLSQWIFSYQTGILTFNGTVSSNRPFKISGYRYIGKKGVTGLQGTTGLGLGATGAQGATGLGVAGIQGITGIPGLQGITGVGIQGATGVGGGGTGIQGVTGVGIQGATGVGGGGGGETGIQGTTGVPGLQGATGVGGGGGGGVTGIQGVTGLIGDEGPQGQPGGTGPQGATGGNFAPLYADGTNIGIDDMNPQSKLTISDASGGTLNFKPYSSGYSYIYTSTPSLVLGTDGTAGFPLELTSGKIRVDSSISTLNLGDNGSYGVGIQMDDTMSIVSDSDIIIQSAGNLTMNPTGGYLDIIGPTSFNGDASITAGSLVRFIGSGAIPNPYIGANISGALYLVGSDSTTYSAVKIFPEAGSTSYIDITDNLALFNTMDLVIYGDATVNGMRANGLLTTNKINQKYRILDLTIPADSTLNMSDETVSYFKISYGASNPTRTLTGGNDGDIVLIKNGVGTPVIINNIGEDGTFTLTAGGGSIGGSIMAQNQSDVWFLLLSH